MPNKKSAASNNTGLRSRVCGINTRSKLIAAGLVLVAVCFIGLRLRVIAASKSLAPTAEKGVAMNHATESELIRMPSHGDGRVELCNTDDGGLTATYRNCSIVYGPGKPPAHINKQLTRNLEKTAAGGSGNPTVLGRIGSISLYKYSDHRISLVNEGNDFLLAERKAADAKLIGVFGGAAIVCHYLWDPNGRTVESLDVSTGKSLWVAKTRAVSWPVVIQDRGEVYVHTGPKRDSVFYEHLYLGGVNSGYEDSIVVVDFNVGCIKREHAVESSVTSLAKFQNVAYVGTASGDIFAISEPTGIYDSVLPIDAHNLYIHTDPVGARVAVCGRIRGISPLSFPGLSQGAYTVTAALGGRLGVSTEAIVHGETQVAIDLPAVLEIVNEELPHLPFSEKGDSHPTGVAGNISVRYDLEKRILRAVRKTTGEIVWQANRVVRPIILSETTVAFTISHSSGAIEYLVAQPISVRKQPYTRKALHRWTSPVHRIVCVVGASVYVADGMRIYAYDAITNRLLWEAGETANINGIGGTLSGALIIIAGGDLICRDILTGMESLRYTGFSDPNQPVPSWVTRENGAYFSSGKALVEVGI